jgi:8-oxo-dGTP diphosphatase
MPAADQNSTDQSYTIIPRVLIFAVRGDDLLMIKGAETKRNWPGLYNGIGGHIVPGETILAAAHREFLEETGLKLIAPKLCAIVTIDTHKNPGIGMFVFRTDDVDGFPSPSPEGMAEWISISTLEEIPLVEDLPELIPIILDWQPTDKIKFGQYYYSSDNELVMRFS